MSDRRRNKEEQKASAKEGNRRTTFFVNGAGIDREVITTDICRYLGNDALVKPGEYVDEKSGRSQQGFFITAYRPLTSAQLQDIKNDSAKWQEEKRRNANRGPSAASYDNSATRQGIWGEDPPSTSTYQPGYPPNPQGVYGAPMPTQNQPRPGYEQYPPSSMPPLSTYRTTQQQPYNNNPQYSSSYITDNSPPPLAVTNYNTMNPRMDEPRSMQPPYQGQPANQPLQQNYPAGGGRGPQYFPPAVVQPGQPLPYSEPSRDYQYGRAPGAVPDQPEYENYSGQDDEDMYDDTPPPGPAPAVTGPARQGEAGRKRTHEPERHRSRH